MMDAIRLRGRHITWCYTEKIKWLRIGRVLLTWQHKYTPFRIFTQTRNGKPALMLRYKGENLALFVGDNLHERVQQYIKTYGYLAEWTYQKLTTGKIPNWSEDMRVKC
jgi:hypothetical protein